MSRRSDRLFRIVTFLQGRRRAVTAERIAEEFSVSTRTIYRDIQDLMMSGVPITGEAGVGYVLDRAFTLPPIQFDEDEIEALVLGLSMVSSWTDNETAIVSRRTMGKINAILGERQRASLQGTALFAPTSVQKIPWAVDFSALRKAIRQRRVIRFSYRDEHDNRTQRTARPLALAFFGSVWLMLGWCELRVAFRNFRLDRMENLVITQTVYKNEPGRSLVDYLKDIPFVDSLRD